MILSYLIKSNSIIKVNKTKLSIVKINIIKINIISTYKNKIISKDK